MTMRSIEILAAAGKTVAAGVGAGVTIASGDVPSTMVIMAAVGGSASAVIVTRLEEEEAAAPVEGLWRQMLRPFLQLLVGAVLGVFMRGIFASLPGFDEIGAAAFAGLMCYPLAAILLSKRMRLSLAEKLIGRIK